MVPSPRPSTGVTRRKFLEAAACLGAAAALPPSLSFAAPGTDLSVLPAANGSAPPPLLHFPSRVHALVWRNWPLVPAERLAAVVGARPREIVRIARAMGLGDQSRISREQQERSYITVIKRNWDLLPYAQLLALLDWPAEKLAFTLREDDFLFVKLGNHKPKCDPLKLSPADDRTRAREAALRRIVEKHRAAAGSSEPLFSFVRDLSRSPRRRDRSTGADLRLCYSYFALYGDPLLQPELDPYPDGYLARLRECGVNAVWLQGVLHKLAPFPWDNTLSARHETRLKNLRKLAIRARQAGVAIYLYLNEPRSMPRTFFSSRPELRGVVEGDHATLCTTHPEVRRWLRDSVRSICVAVPELGGFFTITASENLTNCWSHGQGAQCPRCGKESPARVIAGVNAAFAEGIRDAAENRANKEREDTTAGQALPRLIAWDWGWNDGWAADAIKALPAECAFMSVSEWNLPIERGGVKTAVGEYSISSIGPGPRATRHWAIARQRGLRTVAKIQANNSWELSAVPAIPAVANVARHAANLRQAGVRDIMLGWTLGGYPSANLEVVDEIAGRAADAKDANDSAMAAQVAEAAMRRVAERRFGNELAPHVVKAWRAFSAAFSEFPYHGGVVYSAPLQCGPANLLWPQPTRRAASMVGFPNDDLQAWRAVYPAPVFIGQLEKVADGFAAARRELIQTQRDVQRGAGHAALADELRIAEAAEIHFRSVATQARFVVARDALRAAKNASEASPLMAELEQLLERELDLATRLHVLQTADSRIGFEASNQYYYVPVDLLEKVLNCRDLVDRWLPEEKRHWNL